MTQKKEDNAARKPPMKRRESAPEQFGRDMGMSGFFRYPPTQYWYPRTSNPLPGKVRGSK